MSQGDRKRRRGGRLGRLSLFVLGALGFMVAIDALIVEPRLLLGVTTARIDGRSGGDLAACLGRAKVVHVTDLHVRDMGFRERKLKRLLAEIDPDLVLMTGDYGEGEGFEEAFSSVFEGLRPALGMVAVLGNNDHFRGQRADIESALAAAGVELLVNDSLIIEGPGCDVAIAGVDDPHFGRDDVAAAMDGVDDEAPVILLAHSPDILTRGRSRSLLMNAGDEEGPWSKGWHWIDGSHMRPEPGEILFPSDGPRRLRVQRREDGVAVREIRLVPAGPGPARRQAREDMPAPDHVPGEIVVKAEDVLDQDIHGGWTRGVDGGRAILEDAPDRGDIQTSALVAPTTYFDAGFEARGGVRYHVWVELRSGNSRGTSDSLHLQFTDSLDVDSRPDYRIGVASPEVDSERVDLMLAGHTHGGQVRLPLLGPVERNVRASAYRYGLYSVGGMELFVSRGVGWSFLPVRLMCPPEVVQLEMASGEGEHAGSF